MSEREEVAETGKPRPYGRGFLSKQRHLLCVGRQPPQMRTERGCERRRNSRWWAGPEVGDDVHGVQDGRRDETHGAAQFSALSTSGDRA